MGNIVFVGAGGTGMSGLVGMVYDLGYRNIIAIDAVQSELTGKLAEKGIRVIIGHGNYDIQVDDHIIYSEACVECIEVQTATLLKRKNKQQKLIVNYFQFLGEISKYFQSIGVMGTNGKSTTTAMLIHTAKQIVPNFGLGILGALVSDLGNNSYAIAEDKTVDIKNIFDYIFTGKGLNYKLVKKYYFIVEACEYKRHFLHLDLDWALLTSLELDHTDYFTGIDDYIHAYQQVLLKLRYKCFTTGNFGLKNDKIEILPEKKFNFKHIFGEFQNANATLVEYLIKNILYSDNYNNSDTIDISATLENFHGLRRRMEKICTTNTGAIIFSDYGHVASSIELGKNALKNNFSNKNIHVVFQPHQITRIANNWSEFPQAFVGYATRIIFDIYAARESLDVVKNLGLGNIKTKQELGNVFAKHIGGIYTENFAEILKLIDRLKTNDVLVVYSAGDIDYRLRKHLEVI